MNCLGFIAHGSELTMNKGIIKALCAAGLLNFACIAWGQGTDMPTAVAKVSTLFKRLASAPPSDMGQLEGWAAEYVAATDAAARTAVLNKVAAAAVEVDTFYSRTVMNFADPETNEGEELLSRNLSDYTALIIGFIRDELDYRRILFDDIMYVPSPGLGLPAYQDTNNDAFEQLESLVIQGQQSLAANLTQVTQSGTTDYPIQAGIYSLRGYGSVFYNDGTNRAPFRFTYMNYLCKDVEEVSDVTRPDIYVRRDVDRAPGGDGEKFRSECVGCHAGMDAQTSAFAFVDFDPDANRITYSDLPVAKVNRNNDTFPSGSAVADDSWINIWYEGSNANLPWSQSVRQGNGPKSWGQAMAETGMFPSCMAERVYKVVCLKSPDTQSAREEISSLANQFTEDNYNMKSLFINTAVTCGEGLNF